MLKSLGTDGVDIELIEHVNDTYSKKDYELGSYISSATYIRLRLPSILGGISKVLYLDGDTIIQKDLRQFYSKFDVSENFTVAGSIDYGTCIDSIRWEKTNYIRQQIPEYETEYVNAGVLVMNLDRLREIGFEKKCQELYEQRSDFIFADQDIINFSLRGTKKIFPIFWNCPILSISLNYGKHDDTFLKDTIRRIYGVEYGNIFDIVHAAGIIHVNGSKDYIGKIPVLRELYEKHLEMALRTWEYKTGGTI